MADSIIIQILDKLATAASAATGVTELYRATTIDGLGRTSPVTGLVEMLVEDESNNDAFTVLGARIGLDQPVAFFLHVRPSDNAVSPEPIQTTVLRMEADFIKAIMADTQWDGLAINTRLVPGEWFITEPGTSIGRIIRIIITYRVNEANPYSIT